MCNSGSSALYLAVELLGLRAGRRGHHLAADLLDRHRPAASGPALVPVFVDVEPDTFQIDVDAIEAMIGPRTKAILAPNLIGNAPDWDRIRAIADAHGLQVIEDSCDALGATLRGTPTGTRSDIRSPASPCPTSSPRRAPAGWSASTTTSPGSTGPCCSAAGAAAPRSSSSGQPRGCDKRFFSDDRRRPRVRQPLHLRRGRVGTSSPSELVAPPSVTCSSTSSPRTSPRRQRNFARLCEGFGRHPEAVRAAPDAGGPGHGLAHVPVAPPARVRASGGASSRPHMEAPRRRHPHGLDRQRPAPARLPGHRPPSPEAGLPNADRVMEHGVVLPSNHGLTDADVDYIVATADAFLHT